MIIYLQGTEQAQPGGSAHPDPVSQLLTWVVPAASSGASPAPGALVKCGIPIPEGSALKGIRGKVADFQFGELTDEVSEGHPEGPRAEVNHSPPS